MGKKRARGRIQGGEFGGIPLDGLPGDAVRPTTGRVKEALFSMLGDRVVDAVVVDCFAGTGSLGIEALSRGAAQVLFVEMSAKSISVLELNLARIDPAGSVRILRRDALRPGSWGGDMPAAHLILADPPYGQDLGGEFLRALSPKLLQPGGWVVVEHEAKAVMGTGPWRLVETRSYGESAFSVFDMAGRHDANRRIPRDL